MREKGVNELRFVKYYSKYQDKKKLLTFQLFCLADQYCYYIARGQLSGKDAWKQVLNFQVKQITDGTKMQTYAGLKSPSQKIEKKS